MIGNIVSYLIIVFVFMGPILTLSNLGDLFSYIGISMMILAFCLVPLQVSLTRGKKFRVRS